MEKKIFFFCSEKKCVTHKMRSRSLTVENARAHREDEASMYLHADSTYHIENVINVFFFTYV